MELGAFSYEIKYRSGADNMVADALTRDPNSKAMCDSYVCSSKRNVDELKKLHVEMCCPGVKRLYHLVKARNLPFSLSDVEDVCQNCRTCCELKPRFYRPEEGTLIKATQPYERFSIDHKGPVSPGVDTGNRYLLTVVDEYSRFPWAFSCKDQSADTVKDCLTTLMSNGGAPGYIHSDRGSAFMSKSMKEFLIGSGIATSRTTPYHPRGNGQCEKFNGTIWRSIKLYLNSHGLPDSHWERVLPIALHSIRSLLCTATNNTPHERMFTHQRRAGTFGGAKALPTWLTSPGKVFLRNFERSCKNSPLVKQVDLIEANHHYAHVRMPDGREDTVSTRDLAPYPREDQNDLLQISYPDNEEAGSSNLSFETEERTDENVEIDESAQQSGTFPKNSSLVPLVERSQIPDTLSRNTDRQDTYQTRSGRNVKSVTRYIENF